MTKNPNIHVLKIEIKEINKCKKYKLNYKLILIIIFLLMYLFINVKNVIKNKECYF